MWNIAAIGKLAWWILTKKDHLWIRWVDCIFLKGRNWLSYVPSSNSSWAWRKVCEVKDKFKEAFTDGLWNDDTGVYSIAKRYSWLTGSDDQKVGWYAMVWNRFNTPKHNFIIWLIHQVRLFTLDRLARMGICLVGDCFLCGTQPETHQNLFQHCVYVKTCFKYLKDWMNIYDQGLKTGMETLRQRRQSLLIRMRKCAGIVGVYYHVWMVRNTCRQQHYILCHDKLMENVRGKLKLCFIMFYTGNLKHDDVLWCQKVRLL
ncbi:uncharacterized protein LOC141588603 [Silene latifolia]|uniref:uncharacterized protein LOC141588603 n=1 Tax=Silene latifolia TaxID=37657 RepID=UPI003D78AD31